MLLKIISEDRCTVVSAREFLHYVFNDNKDAAIAFIDGLLASNFGGERRLAAFAALSQNEYFIRPYSRKTGVGISAKAVDNCLLELKRQILKTDCQSTPPAYIFKTFMIPE